MTTTPRPTGLPAPDPLGRALAQYALLAVDHDAAATAPALWRWTEREHRRLAGLLRDHAPCAGPVERLTADPQDLAAFERLAQALARELAEDTEFARVLTMADRVIRRSSRLALHVGEAVVDAQDVTPLSPEEILATVDHPRPGPAAAPTVATVVIPFRSADRRDGRARNLAACLAALHDQDLPRDRYRIVVVESDAEPRWASLFEAHVDRYVFAYNPGPFNKAWAVNCGVVHAGGPDEFVCILDGDVLPSAGFLTGGLARFADDDTLQGHWPYRDIVFCDARSSERAVTLRCAERHPEVDGKVLRGAVLRRPPGGCVWIRRRLFNGMSGMDERFEGWGGEDNDFAWRAEFYGGLERFDDTLLHLHHERATTAGDSDGSTAAGAEAAIPWCTWPPNTAVGDLDRYRDHRRGG
jgi:hypothetical protein